MRLLTFEPPGSGPRLGLELRGAAVDLARAAGWLAAKKRRSERALPADMLTFLEAGPGTWDAAGEAAGILAGEELLAVRDPAGEMLAWPLESVRLRASLPRPRSLRDFYAFEQHVRTAFSLRGQSIPPEWYDFPVFYFGAVASIHGPGDIVVAPAGSQALDFELEVAAVVGRGGRNLDADEAEAAIFGYTILNDWSARDLQRKEMRVGLGPAKGKDFASSLGPVVVTSDELADRRTGRPGVFDAEMRARINGVDRSRGNWKDIHYSFGDMLARASADATLEPGDVIGSGTVGSGCLLELTAGQGPWLQPGDGVELEVEGLGVLMNRVGHRRSVIGDR
jgi:fumarylacetoacetate (FAA) hydrolase